jgi:hypothetical protein
MSVAKLNFFDKLSSKYEDPKKIKILKFCKRNPQSDVAVAISLDPSVLDRLDGLEGRVKVMLDSLEIAKVGLETAIREFRIGQTDC